MCIEAFQRGTPVFCEKPAATTLEDLARLRVAHAEAKVPFAALMGLRPFTCTPPLTCQALSHGSNVLCEKPLRATIQEAEEMSQAEKAAGRFVAVG